MKVKCYNRCKRWKESGKISVESIVDLQTNLCTEQTIWNEVGKKTRTECTCVHFREDILRQVFLEKCAEFKWEADLPSGVKLVLSLFCVLQNSEYIFVVSFSVVKYHRAPGYKTKIMIACNSTTFMLCKLHLAIISSIKQSSSSEHSLSKKSFKVSCR